MTQKETSELVVEEMEVVNTAEVSDNSANAEDVPVVAINEENEIEDNLPPAVDYLDPTLFKDIRTITKADLDSSVKQTEVSENIQDQYLGSISEISENQVLTGRVIGMNEKDILIDIGFKSEGLIDRSEFLQNALPQIGDKIEVYLEYLEDRNGNLVLSKEKADFMRRWRDIREFYEKEIIFTCKILRRIKGGMIVNIDGLQGFLPGSQIDVRPIKDFDQYLDQDLEVRVVKLNEARKNIVVSHKVIIEDSLKEKREELLADIEIGQIMDGRVKNITDFGVFIDLGGIDGLLHITDLSWGRVNHPSEVVELDETLSVKIIDYDQEKQRVSLGLKQLMPHPWENVEENYPIGSNVNGKIVSLTNYGAFVELEAGVEGLIHVSEMSWTRHIKNASEIYSIGDEIKAGVLAIDTDDRKISLGVKQLEPDPWDEIEEKFMVGSLQKGKVINITQFGVFVELEEGIEGLIHVSDLSWTKVVHHPRETVKKDNNVEVRILEISREKRRIALGLKQVTDDPWPELMKKFETGKEITGEIIRILEKGIILQLEDDVEGIVPFGGKSKKSRKEVLTKLSAGDSLTGHVMEVKPDDKKVVVFIEELSGEINTGSKEDEVTEFLNKQDKPASEKIKLPDELTEGKNEEIEPE
ncbi:MAG: 30S ribosomal protein S1 [Candidatus Neomarinimicrobiota bacterium]|jgi:small subunit ribosomal protein S1|nr:30S ribosomal protein S1 [Candidatus Neomarinimicrobiota bacterium]